MPGRHDIRPVRPAVLLRRAMVASIVCAVLAGAGIATTAAAQSAADEARATRLERERIAAQRRRAEADFTLEQTRCYQRFAVNACLRESRERRRSVLAPLREREIELNDLERRRRADEQQRKTAERESERARRAAAADADADAGRAKAPAPAPGLAAPAGPRGERTPNRPMAPRRQSSQAGADQRRAEEAARRAERGAQDDANALRHEQKLREAAEHRARVLRDNAARDKKAAPLPPAGPAGR